MRRTSGSSWRIGFAALLVVTLTVPRSEARANGGLMYGPEDAVVFGATGPGDPNLKLEPGVRGYCVPWSMLAAMHVGFGVSLTGGASHRALVDLTESIRCGRALAGNPLNPGLVIMPRVGYTFETGGGGTQLGRVGLGVGYGTARAAIMYAPHLVLGHDSVGQAGGLRHGMLVSLASDLVSFELSHQLLFTQAGLVQDVRAVGSVNLLILAYVLAH